MIRKLMSSLRMALWGWLDQIYDLVTTSIRSQAKRVSLALRTDLVRPSVRAKHNVVCSSIPGANTGRSLQTLDTSPLRQSSSRASSWRLRFERRTIGTHWSLRHSLGAAMKLVVLCPQPKDTNHDWNVKIILFSKDFGFPFLSLL